MIGIAKDVPNSIYMTIGTGVGAGVISQNHIFNGRTHTELGHMRLNRLPGTISNPAAPTMTSV